MAADELSAGGGDISAERTADGCGVPGLAELFSEGLDGLGRRSLEIGRGLNGVVGDEVEVHLDALEEGDECLCVGR